MASAESVLAADVNAQPIIDITVLNSLRSIPGLYEGLFMPFEV